MKPLKDLAKLNERPAKIVELRFFGGLTVAETAEAPGVSASTVEKDFAFTNSSRTSRVAATPRRSGRTWRFAMRDKAQKLSMRSCSLVHDCWKLRAQDDNRPVRLSRRTNEPGI
jgi:hypothetical protein